MIKSLKHRKRYIMKIFTFDENNNEWIEYNYVSFDEFFDDIVQNECAFRFANCEEKEIDDFLDNISEESGCLDDCDYYSFSCERRTSDTIKDTYIFDNLVLYTLDEIIALRQRHLNYFKELKKKL